MHSDKPVTDHTLDRFQRYNFAKRVAQTILSRPTKDSLTIGLYGQWGEGKTSVIEFISRELDQKSIIIRFNPWQFAGEQNLLTHFFEQLAAVLAIKLVGWRDKASKVVNEYGTLFSTVPYLSKDVVNTLSKVLAKATVPAQRQAVTDALLDADQPVVVFIDDIDRLESTEIQAVFKLVKSVADFPNVIYVLALDPIRVAEALKPTFGDGQAYLEKIIQVPLTLPKAQPNALRMYAYELINQAVCQDNLKILEDELRFFKSNFEKCLADFIKHPRDPARISNAIMFALPMLKGEVHLGDLMLLETIKVLLPDLYGHVRENSSIYLRTYNHYGQRRDYEEKERQKKLAKEALDSQLVKVSEIERGKILSLLKELFPQVEGLYSNIEYAGDDRYKKWHQQKRLCSTHHFDRYFTYAVIEGQISDIVFQDLITMLTNDSLDATVNYFDKALTNLDISDFIYKLHFFEESFLPEQAAQLARVLCRLGDKFYIKNDLIFSVVGYTVDLIKKCLAIQKEEERGSLISELVELISPIGFALRLHDVLWEAGRRDDAVSHVLNSTQLSLFESGLIKRLLLVDSIESFSKLDEGELRRMLYAWIKHGHDKVELRKLTDRFLGKDVNFSLKIISIMAPTIHSTRRNKKETSRDQIKSELSNEDYNLLLEILDIDKLYQCTLKQYGEQSYTPNESSSYPELTNNELIGQFQQLYLQKKWLDALV